LDPSGCTPLGRRFHQHRNVKLVNPSGTDQEADGSPATLTVQDCEAASLGRIYPQWFLQAVR
jgi:hypothetical protein